MINEIKDILNKMQEALLSDNESNLQKKPAFKRLLLLPKIDNLLRK